jgi:hypothetical protein
MTDTYSEAMNILIPDLFNIVKQYYYTNNMYPFLQEVKEYSFYNLDTVKYNELYRYDISKENQLLRQYNNIYLRIEDLKDSNLTPEIYNIKKEILFLDSRSYNNKLKELRLYADIDGTLKFIKMPMGDSWDWNEIEEYENDDGYELPNIDLN